jgi:hypothetical protein
MKKIIALLLLGFALLAVDDSDVIIVPYGC